MSGFRISKSRERSPRVTSGNPLTPCRHLDSTRLRVLEHHGQTKTHDVERLRAFDIVLTTYATLVSEYRNERSALYDVDWFRIVLDEGKSLGTLNQGVPDTMQRIPSAMRTQCSLGPLLV